MTRIVAHLVRGAIAAVLIVLALSTAQDHLWLAISAGVLAMVAMRGCPACWTLMLFVTIADAIGLTGASSSIACSSGVPVGNQQREDRGHAGH
jgi:hypothetical protein